MLLMLLSWQAVTTVGTWASGGNLNTARGNLAGVQELKQQH
jgi:hypothetical protein